MEAFGSEARIGLEVYISPKKKIKTSLLIIMAVLDNDDPGNPFAARAAYYHICRTCRIFPVNRRIQMSPCIPEKNTAIGNH